MLKSVTGENGEKETIQRIALTSCHPHLKSEDKHKTLYVRELTKMSWINGVYID